MLFVVLTQMFFNYLIHRKGRRYAAIQRIILKPFFIFLPWFLFVLIKKNFFTSSFWIERINIKTFVNLLGIIYTGYERGITWISLSVMLLLIIGLKVKQKNRQDRLLALYLAFWGIGIPFTVALVSFVKPIFLTRYLILSTVGFLLLLVLILERLGVGMRFLALILLFIVALNYQKYQIQDRKKRDFQKFVREVKVLAKKDDLIYVTSELDFFTAKYYLAKYNTRPTYLENKVYIYNKSYEEIPDFVGKVLISKNDIAPSLPFYPKKAFVLKPDGTYNIQALY